MAAHPMVLIVIAALAALVLTVVLALVACRTRSKKRHGKGETVRDQADEGVLAAAYRSEAVTSRDQLNELRVHRLAG